MSSKVIAKGRKWRQADVMAAMKNGKVVESVRIGPLDFNHGALFCGLTLRHCVIDSISVKDFQFHAAVSLDDCEITELSIWDSVQFHELTTFRRVQFSGGARFLKSVFHARTHFNLAHFQDWSRFEKCQFLNRTLFSKALFDLGGEFVDTEFSGRRQIIEQGHQYSFNDMECGRRFHIRRCHFNDATTFTGSRFNDITEIQETQFYAPLRVKHAHFMRHLILKSVRCHDEFHLNGTNCEGDMLFPGTTFYSLVNLTSIYGQRNVDFLQTEFADASEIQIVNAHFGRLLIQRDQVEKRLKSLNDGDFQTARREYGILKIGFRDANEYEQEDWAYVMEKRMERYCLPLSISEPIPSLKRISNYLALDLASGYGTKPLNILFTSIILLLAFALLYTLMGASAFGPDAEGWGPFGRLLHPRQALILSFRIFTNAEINSVEPGPGFPNILVMLESFLGFFVMMILVVTYSRKVIR